MPADGMAPQARRLGRPDTTALASVGVGLVALCALAACATVTPDSGQGEGGGDAATAAAVRRDGGRSSGEAGLDCAQDRPARRAFAVAVDGNGRIRWQVQLAVAGNDDSSVGAVVGGDMVYTTQGRELRALSGADGRQRWRLPLDGMVYDATVRDGVVVVIVGPVERGTVLGVDAATGAVRWRFAFDPGGGGRSLSGWNLTVTDDGGVVVVTGGRLVLLDRQTGVPRWERRGRDRMAHSTAAAGGLVLLVSGGRLEAYQAASGRPAWASRLDDLDRGHAPLVVDGVVLAVAPFSDAVAAFDLASGRRLWRYGPRDGQAWVVGTGPAGVALGGNVRGRDFLALVDLRTGVERWRRRAWVSDAEQQRFVGRVLVDASQVVAVERFRDRPLGSRPGKVVARSVLDGRTLWQLDLDDTPTVLPGGRLLFRLLVGEAKDGASPRGQGAVPPQGEVVAVDTAGGNGTIAWRLRLPAFAGHDPAPLGTGVVYQVHDPVWGCATPGVAPG